MPDGQSFQTAPRVTTCIFSNAEVAGTPLANRHPLFAKQSRTENRGRHDSPGGANVGPTRRIYPPVVFRASVMSLIAACSASLTSWPCSR
jgi:hypothetical protein